MARINLLPWRENLRAQRRRDFVLMLVAFVILTLLGMGYWHYFNQSLIDHQQNRNRFLEAEIAKIDKDIVAIRNIEKTRVQLVSRMNIIQSLQSSRPLIVHLFDELVATLPDGVFLTKVKQSGASVRLEGLAQSNARVSAYMRLIQVSAWLANPRLGVIEHKEKQTAGSNFHLTMTQVLAKRGADK